jgi:peroxiredoxin/uncharacterized membrane protein YphA (DoxX/SURF4 family)
MTGLDASLLTARVLLAGVFLVAGIAKLFDRDGSRRALTDFGVPERLARWLDILLPIGECVVAVALLPGATAWLGSVGALSLLTLFTIGIGVSLARGRRPDCHCFGQLHSAPVGWSTLIRSAILGCMAAFVVLRGRGHVNPSLAGLLGSSDISQVFIGSGVLLSVGLLIAVAAILIQLLRQQGRVLLRLESIEGRFPAASIPSPPQGLPVGSRAPSFSLRRLDGGESSLDSWLILGKPVLLFFTNPNCGPCRSLLPDLANLHRKSVHGLSIVLISEGTAADNLSKIPYKLGPAVLLQKEREVAEAYQAYGTPAAVLIRPDGTIGSPLAMGAEPVHAMAQRTVELSTRANNGSNGRRSRSAGLIKLGEIAPPLQLQDFSGRDVSLSSLLEGGAVLLLFWNPDCGFCQRMWGELKSWDANSSPSGPRLVVISSGTIEQNRSMRLRSPVMSDRDSTVSSAFGAHGTPMAVLLDSDGRVASEVAAGQEAVLALAGIEAERTVGARGNG